MMRGRGYSHYHHHYRHGPSPAEPPALPENFTVVLRRPLKDPKPLNPRSIDDLITSLPSPPNDPLVFPSRGGIAGESTAAKLFFPCLSDALDAVAFLWGRRLDQAHFLIPEMVEIRGFPSLKAEELQRVKQLFIGHVEFLLNGEIVNKCRKRAEEVERDIKRKSALLSKPKKINVVREIQEEKRRLEVELELMNGKLEEFTISMKCILSYLSEGKDRILEAREFDVFKFGRDLDLRSLARIHSVVMRECRRLSDGLPIYASRRKLLQAMFLNQV